MTIESLLAGRSPAVCHLELRQSTRRKAGLTSSRDLRVEAPRGLRVEAIVARELEPAQSGRGSASTPEAVPADGHRFELAVLCSAPAACGGRPGLNEQAAEHQGARTRKTRKPQQQGRAFSLLPLETAISTL